MRLIRLFLLCFLLATFARGAEQAAPAAGRPKLVVAILVDQLRYDYLERFHDQFVEGGFKRLTDQGAFMTFARYNYSPTTTGPGHATVFSGAPPTMHGVIGNDWFDKRTRKMLNCVGDATVSGVGAMPGGGKQSPRNFIGSNFADQVRLRFQTKVVGISMKDRGAILPAGKKPAGAYWFEAGSGNFITSTYYRPALPAWVNTFNQKKRAAEFIGQTWTRLLDEKFYERPDNGPGEANLPGEKTPTFPHVVAKAKAEVPIVVPFDPEVPTTIEGVVAPKAPGPAVSKIATPAPVVKENYGNIAATPFSNQLLVEFAKAAVEGETLGTGTGPDLLTVSFSAVDACGHSFGPYSQEVQDIVLRLDQQLADFFTYLDQKFGAGNYDVMLTADHGVMPTPEFATQQGFDGGRSDEVPLVGDLVAKLSERFATPNVLLVRRFIDGNIYFNHDALREKSIAPSDVASFIREWALNTGRYQAVYSREQLLDGRTPGLLGERVFNGYNAERSGDVVLVYKPYIINSGGKTGTTHGSPYSYDTHVPVIFYGSRFKAGRYADEFYITDVVPTLCAALHLDQPPMSIGKPFVKILANP